jgi:hypothetical protein
MGDQLPDDDAELLLSCLQAVVAAPADRGLDIEEETMLDTLEHADWLGGGGLARAGRCRRTGRSRRDRARDESCPEVNIPAGIDLDERSGLEAAFSIVGLAWIVAGCVDRDDRLTAVGEWMQPRALARAWATDFDAA